MGKELKIAVLGSTNGTDLQPVIDAIAAKKLNAKIVMVGSDKKDAYILERAARHGIETKSFEYQKGEDRAKTEAEIVAEFKRRSTDIVLLIGFMKIITPYFVGEFRHRIWNLHPSLLPKYAGGMDLDVHRRVIENKESQTGCTLHEVTEDLDSGRIIMQKSCRVEKEDTPATLKVKVQKLEQECLIESLKGLSEGSITTD
jgi:phosphoribosylglycinamide formyltransferase 1